VNLCRKNQFVHHREHSMDLLGRPIAKCCIVKC
jgi:hypothetical protein